MPGITAVNQQRITAVIEPRRSRRSCCSPAPATPPAPVPSPSWIRPSLVSSCCRSSTCIRCPPRTRPAWRPSTRHRRHDPGLHHDVPAARQRQDAVLATLAGLSADPCRNRRRRTVFRGRSGAARAAHPFPQLWLLTSLQIAVRRVVQLHHAGLDAPLGDHPHLGGVHPAGQHLIGRGGVGFAAAAAVRVPQHALPSGATVSAIHAATYFPQSQRPLPFDRPGRGGWWPA